MTDRLVELRLLTSVQGDDGVSGDAGDVVVVSPRVARVWADGVRAERVLNRVVPVEHAAAFTEVGEHGPVPVVMEHAGQVRRARLPRSGNRPGF